MNRSYIRPEPRCSGASQKAAIATWGGKINAEYSEDFRQKDDSFPERTAWIASLRPGNLAVVSDFHRLATTADELKEVRGTIRKQGAIILEARTGRRSDNPDDLGDMIQEAIDFYRQRGLTPAQARRLARLGADASPATKFKPGRMPKDEALVYLNNPALDIHTAIAAINRIKKYKTKWTVAFAYREKRAGRLVFISRDAGPKPKK